MAQKLHTIRPWWLVIIALVFAAFGWFATLVTARLGWPTPGLPYSTLVTLGLLIAVLLTLGLRVRSWRDGRREQSLSPILAARTFILAQASSYGGALLFGWHTGVLADALTALGSGAPVGLLFPSLALMAGSLVVIAVGLLVERFCRIPPEDNGATPDGTRGDEREVGEEA